MDELWLLFDWRCGKSLAPELFRGPFKMPRFGGFGGTGGNTRTYILFCIHKYNEMGVFLFIYWSLLCISIDSRSINIERNIRTEKLWMNRWSEWRGKKKCIKIDGEILWRDNEFCERFSYYWSMVLIHQDKKHTHAHSNRHTHTHTSTDSHIKEKEAKRFASHENYYYERSIYNEAKQTDKTIWLYKINQSNHVKQKKKKIKLEFIWRKKKWCAARTPHSHSHVWSDSKRSKSRNIT